MRAPDQRPTRRPWLLRAALAAVLGAVLAAGGCARSDPERELRTTVDAMARAIETGEPGEFLDALADDFTRDSGAFGKQEAKRLLAGLMLRNERIRLAVVVTEVQVDGDRAQVKLRVLATGSAGGLVPERGQALEFDSRWRRSGGRWQVFNAEWREGL
jgi:hypothetical protein